MTDTKRKPRKRTEPTGDRLTIELLILANHVEAINGLLYVSGGGWTDHFRVKTPTGAATQSYLGIGVSILVPWNETNQRHQLAIRIENEDATANVAQIGAEFNVGRLPTATVGAVQHAVVAVPMALVFPAAGGYRIVAELDNGDRRQWSFRVHDIAGPMIQMPPSGQQIPPSRGPAI